MLKEQRKSQSIEKEGRKIYLKRVMDGKKKERKKKTQKQRTVKCEKGRKLDLK